jgi:hypothetical protein
MTPKRFGRIELEFDKTCDDVVSAALAMLASGLSRLSAEEREERLQKIEDGALRRLVSGFVVSRRGAPQTNSNYVMH